jgi:Predicted membrane protein (DUF2306)
LGTRNTGAGLNRRIAKLGLTAISFAVIAAFLYLAYFGEKIAIEAIRLLPAGPLGDLYPGWSLWHFLSAIIFLTLALFQLIPRLRMRFPIVHRVSGRIAILAALVAAISAVAIATVAQSRPMFWRFWVALQFAPCYPNAVSGARRGKERSIFPAPGVDGSEHRICGGRTHTKVDIPHFYRSLRDT